MDNKTKILIGIGILAIIGIILSSGCINNNSDVSDYPKTVKSMSNSEINDTIEKIRVDLQNGDKYDISIKKGSVDDEGLMLSVHQTVYNQPTTFGGKITLDDAKKIALNFVKEHDDIFNIYEGEEIKITEATYNNRTEVFIIGLAPHEYKGIPLYKDYGGGMHIYKDGKIKDVGTVLFKDVSAPTSPKITDDQMKDIISKKFSIPKEKCDCESRLYIYPKYNSTEQSWSYHLIKRCLNRENYETVIMDTITGDIMLIETRIGS